MNQYARIPEKINFPLLIELLRSTYTHGDGGLAAESGIDSAVLSRCAKHGVHSLENGVKIWNIAVKRLSYNEARRCDLSAEQGSEKNSGH